MIKQFLQWVMSSATASHVANDFGLAVLKIKNQI